MTDPIVIWGAGAIGGSLGAGLIKAGHAVIFVDTVRDHVDAINANGLQIVGPLMQATVRAQAALPEDLRGTYKRIFLCVKALNTAAASRAIAPHLAADGYVVSAQNGLNELTIADAIGRQRTVGCFVNFGADYLEPGVVQYSGRGAVVVGELDGAPTERIAGIHRLLQDFEPNAVLTGNIWGYLWGKLIYGAQLFATALTNESIADCLAEPKFRPVLAALGQEVGAVAKANGVATEAFNGFDPAAFMPGAPQILIDKSFDDMVAFNRRSAKSHSGIWRDLAIRKRQTEVEPQLGPIVSTGRQLGVPTPLTARLVEMIVEMEQGKRSFSADNLSELAGAGQGAK
ncbi:MAG: ketopantoate reductase family protein [Devosia sp.]